MSFIYELFGKILYLIYSVIGNYGFSIIVFTILVKLLLIPLTKKQTDNTKKMQEIQPKLQEIQKKYGNNREKLNKELLKLYDEYNYKPTAGCLPLLIQFPIIIGLFRVIQQPEVYVFPKGYDVVHKFLWISDLSKPDPYYILPVLAAIFTYFSMKVSTPQQQNAANTDTAAQTQKTMAMVMPIMIGFISLKFPAGLALYWVVSNLMQAIQQYIILGKFSRSKEASK
ncbi:YidC/Oxa1 family membrane protein insertase [Garciella nitratireducens]|uniref:YidC/Oxa1 family membrane protein insertase n=1 Tax=Garciella nitratireducens DSM 15102 TaxID=1121911 RepID=A0A1T4PCX6_9FIRM|nr:YidC/Oxa1 family membrane protein insertase [Garciella nitratireducens]SJZ89413.1 YidC/Oxa1 family membrane protein insertase [Garciella nitratireducens DSM 15102]